MIGGTLVITRGLPSVQPMRRPGWCCASIPADDLPRITRRNRPVRSAHSAYFLYVLAPRSSLVRRGAYRGLPGNCRALHSAAPAEAVILF